MNTAAKHLGRARLLFDLLTDAQPADDDDAADCIAAFRKMADAVRAGLAAVDASTPRSVVLELEMLQEAASRMEAAAHIALASERARLAATASGLAGRRWRLKD